jgi:hypothetical protein
VWGLGGAPARLPDFGRRVSLASGMIRRRIPVARCRPMGRHGRSRQSEEPQAYFLTRGSCAGARDASVNRSKAADSRIKTGWRSMIELLREITVRCFRGVSFQLAAGSGSASWKLTPLVSRTMLSLLGRFAGATLRPNSPPAVVPSTASNFTVTDSIFLPRLSVLPWTSSNGIA